MNQPIGGGKTYIGFGDTCDPFQLPEYDGSRDRCSHCKAMLDVQSIVYTHPRHPAKVFCSEGHAFGSLKDMRFEELRQWRYASRPPKRPALLSRVFGLLRNLF